MQTTSYPDNDNQYYSALQAYPVLDTVVQQDFDDFCELASVLCDAPIALISLLDNGRQWFKFNKAIDSAESDKISSFCTQAMLTGNEALVAEDTRNDKRFKDHPFVKGEPYFSFYAGIPLVNKNGFTVGHLCVIDYKSKKLAPAQLKALQILARQVMDKLELHQQIAASQATSQQLEKVELRYKKLKKHYIERESKLRRLVEQVPVAIATFMGPDFIVDFFNNKLLQHWDRTAEQVKNLSLFTAVPEVRGLGYEELLMKVLNTGERYVTTEHPVMLKRKGKLEPAWFDFSYDPLRDAAGNICGIILVSIEVTEKVIARLTLEKIIAEKAALEIVLRNDEQRLQSVLDTMAEGLGITDTTGKLVYANPMAQKILGLTENEIKERTFNDPKWNNTRLDGSPLPPEDHPMAVMMRTGMPVYDYEIGIQPDGREPFYISMNAAPLLDHTGVLIGGISTFMDVTARRRLLRQKEEFIGIASHELRTPLTALKVSIDLLYDVKDDPALSPLVAALISQSHRNTQRLLILINDLLDVSRIEGNKIRLKKTKFTIANMVYNCCPHVRTAGTHDIIITGDKELQICADEQRISQVIVNLVNNAVKFAPDVRQIIVAIESLSNKAKVSVQDFGPGIPKNRIPHLFDRFYQAGQGIGQGGGLGLGLYISAEIIRSHNGEIGVESELGKGSTFWFTLPIINDCD